MGPHSPAAPYHCVSQEEIQRSSTEEHKMEIQKGTSNDPTLPMAVTVQITAKCNLYCSHCAVVSAATSGATWTKCMVDQLFAELGDRTPILDITGGEPLLAWEVVSLFGRRAATQKMLWGITTNGTLLTDRHVQDMLEMGIYAVKVSVDGLREHHDEMRGPGNFERALQAIRRLVRVGIPVGVQTTLSQTNRHEIRELVSIMDDEGVSSLILFPLMPLGRQAKMPTTVLRGTQLKQVVLETREISTNQLKIHMELPECGSLLEEMSKRECAQCTAGFMVHYTADGVAWPCPVFPLRLGALGEDTIDDLMRTVVLKTLRGREGILGSCKTCKAFTVCGGGCRAMAYLFGGNLHVADPFCWMNNESEPETGF